MTTVKEIVSNFGPNADKPEIISQLEKLMKLHALSVEDIYIKWEQFSYQRHKSQTDLSTKNVELFKDYLQLQVEKKAHQIGSSGNVNSSVNKPRINKPLASSPSLFGFNIPKTPIIKKRKLNTPDTGSVEKTSTSKLEFKSGDASGHSGNDRGNGLMSSPGHINSSQGEHPSELSIVTPTPLKNSKEFGTILDSLNPNEIEISEGMDFEKDSKVKITGFYEPKKYKFRTMRQILQDAADVLDDQIEVFTKLVQKHYELLSTDFGDPSIQSQSEIYAVGRIVPDSPTADGFLNTESLALETSRMTGIGRRVRLDLTKVNEFSLFAGQLVAFKGKNANGDFFMVEEILSMPYPDLPVSTMEEIQESHDTLNNQNMKVIITSGPYWGNTSFDTSSLELFVEKVNTEIKPHILIMFGPFIDVTHPMIAKGSIPNFPGVKVQPQTLDEVFTKVMAPILKNINSKIQVILIPSTRDAMSKHAAYPQDSFDRKSSQLPKNFKCFTNPSTFQLNEVFFGCSNVDIFKDMKEITKGGHTSMKNRFDRISEHVLQQRRYYPVFPGGIKKIATETNNGKKAYEHISGADLDVPYLGITEFVGDMTPDIIIIPSELQQFARVVKNVVMINPGRFVRPNGGRGTYTQITLENPNIDNGKLTKIEKSEPVYLHNIWKRLRVDMITS